MWVRRPWTTAARSARRRPGCWPATRGSSPPSWAPSRRCWTWAPRPGCSRPRCGGRSPCGTRAVSGRAATGQLAGATLIMFVFGLRVDRPVTRQRVPVVRRSSRGGASRALADPLGNSTGSQSSCHRNGLTRTKSPDATPPTMSSRGSEGEGPGCAVDERTAARESQRCCCPRKYARLVGACPWPIRARVRRGCAKGLVVTASPGPGVPHEGTGARWSRRRSVDVLDAPIRWRIWAPGSPSGEPLLANCGLRGGCRRVRVLSSGCSMVFPRRGRQLRRLAAREGFTRSSGRRLMCPVNRSPADCRLRGGCRRVAVLSSGVFDRVRSMRRHLGHLTVRGGCASSRASAALPVNRPLGGSRSAERSLQGDGSLDQVFDVVRSTRSIGVERVACATPRTAEAPAIAWLGRPAPRHPMAG